ncbi:GNAT family N-acetyltransferase [Jiangella alba]|uniref:GNAT family N-acetyltransferase n=1 Tax=Jiangella alba TaxID=561176 RepID=UPI00114CF8A2
MTTRFTGDLPGPDGLFEFPRLSRFFADDDHRAFLIHSHGQLAGFCLVRPFDDGASFIHAFFVVRALRRHGVGLAAATELLRSGGGRWVIAFVEQNAPANPPRAAAGRARPRRRPAPRRVRPRCGS